MSEYEALARLLGNMTGAFIAIVLTFISLANYLLERRLIRGLEVLIFIMLSSIYILWVLNSITPPIISMQWAAQVILYLWIVVSILVAMWLFFYSRQKVNKINLGGSSVVVIMNEANRSHAMQKIELPAGIRVPGIFWVILLVVIPALAHRYLDDPFLVELILVAVGLMAPLVIDNNADLKRALTAIKALTGRTIITEEMAEHEEGVRSVRILRDFEEQPKVEDIPEEPNPIKTYIFG